MHSAATQKRRQSLGRSFTLPPEEVREADEEGTSGDIGQGAVTNSVARNEEPQLHSLLRHPDALDQVRRKSDSATTSKRDSQQHVTTPTDYEDTHEGDELRLLFRSSVNERSSGDFGSGRGESSSGGGCRTVVVPNKLVAGQQRSKTMAIREKSPTTSLSVSPTPPASSAAIKRKIPPKLMRAPSVPSMFNRVKDIICEKVFQPEWPHAAAIVQERRQRANQALLEAAVLPMEVIMGLEQMEHGRLGKGTRSRTIAFSDPETSAAHMSASSVAARVSPIPDGKLPAPACAPTAAANRGAARAAFRRRSVSEASFDKVPPIPIISKTSSSSGAAASGERLSTGDSHNSIVCSDDDLMAIVNSHRSHHPQKSRGAAANEQRKKSTSPVGNLGNDAATKGWFAGRISSPAAIESRLDEDLRGGVGNRPTTSSQRTASKMPKTNADSRATSEQASSANITASPVTRSAIQTNTTVSIEPEIEETDTKPSVAYPEIVLDNTSKDGILSISPAKEPRTSNTAVQPADVLFDENGQTWDIYGAECDPEILGSAIQKHLEMMMMSSASSSQPRRRKSSSLSQQSSSDGVGRSRKRSSESASGGVGAEYVEDGRGEEKEGRRSAVAMNVFLRLLCSLARRRANSTEG